jgi:N-carbamoyl-L-amino-acid hydrolase
MDVQKGDLESSAAAEPAAMWISEERLWGLLMEVARFGKTENGGVNRPALSNEDIAAKNYLVQWARERGFGCVQDEIGNLFIRREGRDPSLAPVMAGSHLDSQPTGGRFDGAYGVVAGCEVLQALNDAGCKTRRSIEVVSWTNEEGSRFLPGAMGSSVFAGVRPLSSVLDAKDHDGVSLGEALSVALKAVPIEMRPSVGRKVHSYIEAHIEQGPLLEEAGIPIGVVNGIQGILRLEVDVRGEEAHAGTTPRRLRKDALSAAVSIISDLERLTSDPTDVLRFTIGRCEVLPGSPNTVPGRVQFTIDMRHPDDEVLQELGDRIRAVAEAASKGCAVGMREISNAPPTRFDEGILALIERSSQALAYPSKTMPSGAGHDAMHISKICPTGMIFIPCHKGISHNEAESATAEHTVKGARVLAETLVALAER